IDPADGGRECGVGRGTHRQRIETELRDPRFASHCREVPARWRPSANPDPQQRWLTFVPESRQCDLGLRLLHRRDCLWSAKSTYAVDSVVWNLAFTNVT